jgi:hypothetical protein
MILAIKKCKRRNGIDADALRLFCLFAPKKPDLNPLLW